jgi:hypothetical protein
MITKLGLVSLVLCGALGCGGSGGSGGSGGGGGGGSGGGGGGGSVPPAATDHLIDDAAVVRDVPAGSRFAIGPFGVPDGATVTYTLTDMPQGFGVDSMNAGVVEDSESEATNPTAWGEAVGVSSTEQTTPALAAGTYDLLVRCANVVDDCYFTDLVTAFY